MKNNKTTTSKTLKTIVTLLLFVLSGMQNIKACAGFEPKSCMDYSLSFYCGEDPFALHSSWSTGASIHYICNNKGSYKSCNNRGTTMLCTYTDHLEFCDGSSMDNPMSFQVAEATYDPTSCPKK